MSTSLLKLVVFVGAWKTRDDMTDNSDEKSDPTWVDEYVTVMELFALLDPVSDEDADDGSVITSKTTQI